MVDLEYLPLQTNLTIIEDIENPAVQFELSFLPEGNFDILNETEFVYKGMKCVKIANSAVEVANNPAYMTLTLAPFGTDMMVDAVYDTTDRLLSATGIKKDDNLYQALPLIPMKGVELCNYIQKQKLYSFELNYDNLKKASILYMGMYGLFSNTYEGILNNPVATINTAVNQDIKYYDQIIVNKLTKVFAPRHKMLNDYYKELFSDMLTVSSIYFYRVGAVYSYEGIDGKKFICIRQTHTIKPDHDGYPVTTVFAEVEE